MQMVHKSPRFLPNLYRDLFSTNSPVESASLLLVYYSISFNPEKICPAPKPEPESVVNV